MDNLIYLLLFSILKCYHGFWNGKCDKYWCPLQEMQPGMCEIQALAVSITSFIAMCVNWPLKRVMYLKTFSDGLLALLSPSIFSLSSSCLLPPVSLSKQFCLFFALSLFYLSRASVFCSLCHFQYQSLPLSLVFHLSIFPLSPNNKHCTLDIWQYHTFLVVKIITKYLANYSFYTFVSSFTHIVMILKSTITN